MLSDRWRSFLAARKERLAVLRPVSSNLIVARISAAEQAFPWLIFEAHFRASAMVVTLTKSITSSREQLALNEGGVCA